MSHTLPVSAAAQALFTRLLLQEPGSHLIHMTPAGTQNLSADRDAGERQILRYLYACFQRAREEVGQAPATAVCVPAGDRGRCQHPNRIPSSLRR